jgi:hypothetical protein
MTRDEYFAQDILERIDQARQALDQAGYDPIVFQDGSIGITVADVLTDAHVEVSRLRPKIMNTPFYPGGPKSAG